ncbi:MAG: sulfatase [Candidatus Didemnitutus sp.]|nr:sulfatase [Candidatus Didemnitutus sp.]
MQPNLVFVFSDQQRRHAVGCMGEDPVLTPNLDAFARQGVLATQAVATCPVCTPNRACMLTGRFPHGCGVLANDDVLSPAVPTIGDALRDADYHTAYIGKWHLHHGAQFVPRSHRGGFDFWHANNVNHNLFELSYWEESPEPVVRGSGWQATHETDVALRHLRERPKDKPFALFLSWVAPHNTHGTGFAPYADFPVDDAYARMMEEAGYSGRDIQYHAPAEFEAPYRDRKLPRRPNVPDGYAAPALPGYFGGCTAVDAEFGRLLDYLDGAGLADNTIVVYTSDHGEMLGSHGLMQKFVWHEESISVPLLVRWPGQLPAGARTDALINSPDLMPTLLDLLRVRAPAGLDGRVLSRCLRDPAFAGPEEAGLCFFAPRRRVLEQSGTRDNLGWRALRTPRHLFVADADARRGGYRELLYDLERDPFQLSPTVNPTDAGASDLRRRLATWLAERGDSFRHRLSAAL